MLASSTQTTCSNSRRSSAITGPSTAASSNTGTTTPGAAHSLTVLPVRADSSTASAVATVRAASAMLTVAPCARV